MQVSFKFLFWPPARGTRPLAVRPLAHAALVAAVLIATNWPASASTLWPSVQEHDLKSYRELRYDRVVGQTSWITCGPAAAATLLTHYLAIPASEGDVVRAIAGDTPAESIGPTASTGLARIEGYSMLDLKRALGHYGVESAGYRLSEEVLKAYFDQGGLPVIVHLTKPQAHFAVLVAYLGDRLILADPSFGERVISRSELIDRFGFSGHALVAVPTSEQAQVASERQSAVLGSFAEREGRLRRLGAAL